MIKAILLSMLAFAAIVAVLFSVFAFSHWSINPKAWDGTDRGFFAFMSLFLGVVGAGLAYKEITNYSSPK